MLNNPIIAQVNVGDTAANIQTSWSGLVAANELGRLGAILVSDNHPILVSVTALKDFPLLYLLTGYSTLTVSVVYGQLVAFSDPIRALNMPHALLVTGVHSTDVAALLTNPYVTLISVTDTAADIMRDWSSLVAANTAGKLGSIIVADGNPVTAGDQSFAVIAKLTGASQIIIPVNILNDQGLLDTLASYSFNSPVQLHQNYYWNAIRTSDASSFQALFNLQTFLLQNPSYSLNTNGGWWDYAGNFDAMAGITSTAMLGYFAHWGFHSEAGPGTETAQGFLTYFSSAFYQQVAAVNNWQLPINAVIDNAAGLQAHIDGMAQYASVLARIVIRLTDSLPPTITLSAAQVVNDADVLGRIQTSYLLSIADTASNLNTLDLSTVVTPFIELTPTALDATLTVSTSVTALNLTRLGLSTSATVVETAINSGAGTEIDIIDGSNTLPDQSYPYHAGKPRGLWPSRCRPQPADADDLGKHAEQRYQPLRRPRESRQTRHHHTKRCRHTVPDHY